MECSLDENDEVPEEVEGYLQNSYPDLDQAFNLPETAEDYANLMDEITHLIKSILMEQIVVKDLGDSFGIFVQHIVVGVQRH